ncbi:hypothetical protein NM688_g2481 [Phlebia brevispora]|uniref:Uncharacterized protein n=1 Tax=Phlebia brevispora TaxID=194682 RepID=A0ACC1T8Q4_9APHY|nr:hypothetical protein NM688_g2481 [Phlebia brevispora]
MSQSLTYCDHAAGRVFFQFFMGLSHHGQHAIPVRILLMEWNAHTLLYAMVQLTDDYEQQPVFINLRAIHIQGLRQRTLGRATDSFVTVSVDGEQQFQTLPIRNSLNPEWTFSEPHRLSLYPSSSISFTVYRGRKTEIFREKYLGTFEAPLLTFIDGGESPHTLDTRHCITTETGTISVHLEVDSSTAGLDLEDLFHRAADNMQHVVASSGRRHTPEPRLETAGSILHRALIHLDELIKVADNIADIHPWSKVAWALLSAVYKAIRSYKEKDDKIKEFANVLGNALARARECRNLKAIPGKTNVVVGLTKLVAEGATLIDEYMKHSAAGRMARSAFGLSHALETRIDRCRTKLDELNKELWMDLLIRTYQNGTVQLSRPHSVLSDSSQGERVSFESSTSEETKHNATSHATLLVYPQDNIPTTVQPSSCWSIPTESSHGAHLLGPHDIRQDMPHPAPFPRPMLYPEVTVFTASPDGMRRSTDLPASHHSAPPPSYSGAPLEPETGYDHVRPLPKQAACSQPRRKWHCDFERMKMREMFSSDSCGTDVVADFITSKGAHDAAIDALLEITAPTHESPRPSVPKRSSSPSDAHHRGGNHLGLGITLPSISALTPNLSRSGSSDSDDSVVTTPASENPFHDGDSSVAVCDGYVGGFSMPDTRPLNIRRKSQGSSGWVPRRPLGNPFHA